MHAFCQQPNLWWSCSRPRPISELCFCHIGNARDPQRAVRARRGRSRSHQSLKLVLPQGLLPSGDLDGIWLDVTVLYGIGIALTLLSFRFYQRRFLVRA